MTPGPPPSAAGPSQTAASISHQDASFSQTQPPQAAALNAPYTSQFAVQPQPTTHSYYGGPHHPTFSVAPQGSPIAQGGQPYPSQSTYYAQSTAPGASQTAGSYPYYNYPSNPWTNAWNTGTYQYPSGSSYPYPFSTPQQNLAPQPPAGPTQPRQTIKTPTPSLSPTPPPPPEYHKDWDATIKSFLSTIGFSQALRGFEADMIVLNPEWERKKIPIALAELMKELLVCYECVGLSMVPSHHYAEFRAAKTRQGRADGARAST